ncbi:MAG: aspartate kinase, partial [Spirochaetia bacterium]|nr:aspartate kinase [Spirochaetia bacterium]
MLTVEKIGGTSMSRFGEILDNLILGKRKGKDIYGRIFVVSAYGSVTNWLLEHKKTGENGVYTLFAKQEDYRTALHDLLGRLKEINSGFKSIGLPLD